jgi:hypothetical protein
MNIFPPLPTPYAIAIDDSYVTATMNGTTVSLIDDGKAFHWRCTSKGRVSQYFGSAVEAIHYSRISSPVIHTVHILPPTK